MSAMSIIRQRLSDQSIDHGIYYEMAEDGQDRPFIVLMEDSMEPHNTHNTASKLDRVTCRVLVFGDRYETSGSSVGAKTLADAARNALDRYVVNDTVEVYFQNEQTDSIINSGNKRAYMVEQTYDVWVYRTFAVAAGIDVLQSDLQCDLIG
jgi:hypothetical protein